MLKISIVGNKRLLKTMQDLKDAGADAGTMMKLVSRRMLKMQKKHFDDKKQASGRPWPTLSRATIEARREGDVSKGRAPRPLKDTENLFNSLKASSTKSEAMVGVPKSVPYGVHHQFGSRDGKHPPKREFLFIKRVEQRELVTMLVNPLVAEHLKSGAAVSIDQSDVEELV